MPFNPDQTLNCGCVVATYTVTGDPGWSGWCATALPIMRAMANSEGKAKTAAGAQLRAHAKANGLR
ncbi:hypothetical protein [Streptomyces sp. NPDC058653]|uniref:hypothetical protein n=1 Tax=Streptomyces sp. NPDC058653 TaxID=3346576 RepID=UPI00365A6D41